MNRSRFLFFLLSTALVLPLLAGSLFGAAADEDEAGADSLYKYLAVFTDTLGLVNRAYVEETDVDALMAAALDGVTDALDPMAVYVPPDAVESYLAVRSVGPSHSGLVLLRDHGMVYVLSVLPDSPAEEAGVERGDLIAEIEDSSTRSLPMWQIQQILAGPPGTKLNLHLVRFAETIDTSLTLRPFELSGTEVDEHDGVPVLTIPAIGAETAGVVRGLVSGLADRSELIIDLRGAADGDVAAAYELAGLFAEGDLGTLAGRDEAIETFRTDREPLWHGRLLVLTDRATLGAAEVLATVLRQKAGAELVGSRTFGHAGRESMVELGTGAVLLISDAFYTGPDLVPIDEPLEPDVRVSDRSRTFSELGHDGEDPAELPDVVLDEALEHLKEPPTEAAAEPAEKAAA